MFMDECTIVIKAGDGGNGVATFRREKFVQFGGPNGGDGGKGGDIIFVADPNINTLIDFKNAKKFAAEDGGRGAKNQLTGKDGQTLIIKVPIGTMIRDMKTGKLLLDLSIPDEKVLLLKGGRGGRGNTHFKNSIRKTPRIAESGKEGLELTLKLELKLLADVALVGYPSVGKSSFINKVSAAKSKVANYHFTTLQPKLGVVKLEDEKSFVIADIPGLIEDAHKGAGLGDRFLKHIERCKVIIHIVDISGLEGRTPEEDFIKINEELEKYSPKLAHKPQIVVANKVDMLYDDKVLDDFESFVKQKGYEYVYPVSVIANDGLKPVLYKAWELIKDIPQETLEETHTLKDLFPQIYKQKQDWEITRLDEHVYEVDGQIVDNVLKKYVFLGDEGIINFLQMMRNLGMETQLEESGVQEGDLVIIADYEFEYAL